MEFLRRLFRKSPPSKPESFDDPLLLRDALFKVTDRPAELETLCTAHRGEIAQHFGSWMNVNSYPGFDPKDETHLQYILHSLASIAAMFRDKLNDPSLWNQLSGPSDDNPFRRFEEALAQAKELARDLRFKEAVDLLTSYLIDIKGLAGPGADNFRAYAHGLIGISLFQSNRANDALSHLHQALTLCIKTGDHEGMRVYLEQLYDAHRYLGQPAEAAGFAERLAGILGDANEISRWKAAAARVRAGEPLLRMIVEHDGRRTELGDLGNFEEQTSYRFLFERNRPTLRASMVKTEEGKALGSAGDFDDALAAFREAMKADPFDPDPHYQAGLTLLLLQRYAKAVDELERVGALAPGWFHVASDLWLAQELLAGRLDHVAFVAVWMGESGGDPAERLQVLDGVLARHPRLPHLYLPRGLALMELNRPDEALAALDAGIALHGEPDIHSRLLAQRATLSDPSRQRELFQKIVAMPVANLMSRSMADVFLRVMPQK